MYQSTATVATRVPAEQGKRPSRDPPARGPDEQDLCDEGAVDEAACDRVDRHSGIDLRLHPVGEGAVVRDRDRQQDRGDPDGAMDRADLGRGYGDEGQPAVDPEREPELDHRERQHAGGEPGLERERVLAALPEQRDRVVGRVLRAEDVEADCDDCGRQPRQGEGSEGRAGDHVSDSTPRHPAGMPLTKGVTDQRRRREWLVVTAGSGSSAPGRCPSS